MRIVIEILIPVGNEDSNQIPISSLSVVGNEGAQRSRVVVVRCAYCVERSFSAREEMAKPSPPPPAHMLVSPHIIIDARVETISCVQNLPQFELHKACVLHAPHNDRSAKPVCWSSGLGDFLSAESQYISTVLCARPCHDGAPTGGYDPAQRRAISLAAQGYCTRCAHCPVPPPLCPNIM